MRKSKHCFNIHNEDPTLNLAFRVRSALITFIFGSRYDTNNMGFFFIYENEHNWLIL